MKTTTKYILLLIATAAAVAFSLYFLDKPIANYLKDNDYPHKFPGEVRRAIRFFDSYEQIIPLTLLIITAAISAGTEKWKLIGKLLLAMILSAIPVWIGKIVIARQRPKWNNGTSWLDTFSGLFPGLANMKMQSMPSGDAALDFAISIILANAFPKHRYIFYILAFGSAASRVMLKYHYLSDVIVGSVIGYLAAKIILYITSPQRS